MFSSFLYFQGPLCSVLEGLGDHVEATWGMPCLAGQDWRCGRVRGREGQPISQGGLCEGVIFPAKQRQSNGFGPCWNWFDLDKKVPTVSILTNPIFNFALCLAFLSPQMIISSFDFGMAPALDRFMVEEDFNGLKFQMLFGSQDLHQGTSKWGTSLGSPTTLQFFYVFSTFSRHRFLPSNAVWWNFKQRWLSFLKSFANSDPASSGFLWRSLMSWKRTNRPLSLGYHNLIGNEDVQHVIQAWNRTPPFQ